VTYSGTGRPAPGVTFDSLYYQLVVVRMPPKSLHTACGTHVQELSHGVPGEEAIAVHSGGPAIPGAPTHRRGGVMTARPRLSMRADGLRPQAEVGLGFSRNLRWSEHGLTSRLYEEHHGGNVGTFR